MLRGMRVTRWAVLAGTLALIAGLIYVLPLERSGGGAGVTREDAASDSVVDGVGTAGRDASVPEPEDSPATLHDLETVTGSLDPHELIGTRVDFDLKVGDINDNASFWVGTKDNPMLVVFGRDKASTHGIQPVKRGEMARVTGTIEAIPPAGSRYSWGVNDSLRRELDQKVYIRADKVIPEG
jgi:hypothetical protein